MKLIILDRDGVINFESKDYVKSPEEWRPIPGSLAAIAALNKAGFTVTVATNQSAVGRGLCDEAVLQQIHQKITDALAKHNGRIDKIFYCPHHPDDDCECRKPKTGLFKQIARHYQMDLNEVFFVGDSWRDVQAGLAAGLLPVLLKTGYGLQALGQHKDELASVPVFENLQDFVSEFLT